MPQFIPLPTAVAEKLSRELYHLARPVHVRNPRDVTTHYCGWHVDPRDPARCVLEIPDADTLPVHALATVAEFQKIYADARTRLEGTKVETDLLAQKIQAERTKRLDPHDTLLVKWKADALTREAAIAAGYLPTPMLPIDEKPVEDPAPVVDPRTPVPAPPSPRLR